METAQKMEEEDMFRSPDQEFEALLYFAYTRSQATSGFTPPKGRNEPGGEGNSKDLPPGPIDK